MPNNQVRRRVRAATNVSPIAIAAAGPSGQLRLTNMPVGDFKPPSRNVRRYNNRLIGKLQGSITEFGLIRPVLIDQDGNIIAGVAIWMAARELGLAEVPATHGRRPGKGNQRIARYMDGLRGDER